MIQRDTACRGSASIWVLIMIVFLITMALFTMQISRGSQRQMAVSQHQIAAYYIVDALGEEQLATVDACLLRAQQQAADYMETLYPDMAQPVLLSEIVVPSSFMKALQKQHPNKTLRAVHLNEIYRRLYYYYAAEYLQQQADLAGWTIFIDYPYDSVTDLLDMNRDLPDIHAVQVYFTAWSNTESVAIDGVIGVDYDYYIIQYDEQADDWAQTLRMTPYGKYDRYAILQWTTRSASQDMLYEMEAVDAS